MSGEGERLGGKEEASFSEATLSQRKQGEVVVDGTLSFTHSVREGSV